MIINMDFKDIGKHFLYRHIRTDTNEPFYIGIGTKRTDYVSYRREYTRAYSKRGRNYIWKGITERSDYAVEILLESDSYKEINEKEQEFVNLYGKIIDGSGTLCNFTDGGDGTLGLSHTEEAKESISKTSTQYKVAEYTLDGTLNKVWGSVREFCEYHNCTKSCVYSCLNKKTKTTQNLQVRKVFGEESVSLKIPAIKHKDVRGKEKRKGRKATEETKRRMSESAKGKVVSEETKQKLREINLGKTHTKQTRQKISDLQFNGDGLKVKHIKTGKIYNSLARACRECGLVYKREHSRIRKNNSTKNFIEIE